MGSKFNGVVAIGRATAFDNDAAAKHYLQCGTATIDDTPIIYERDSIVSPDVELGIGGGHKHTFSIDGIELPMDHLGYLLWLALGTQSGTTTHTLTPASAQDYLCIRLDRGLQIGAGGTDSTQVLLGAKIGNLRLEIPKKGFAKCSISGVACDLATADTELTATIPTGANNAPVSWQAIKDGYFKVGYPSTPAADTEITRFALDISRELDEEDGVDLGSDQPTAINEGKRVVTWEVDKQFSGNAKTAYDAWLAQTQVGLDIDMTVGAYSAVLTAAYGNVIGSFAKEVGASAESIMATLQVRTHRNNSSTPVLQAIVTDSETIAYT